MSSSTTRIAKNTLMLYFRLIIVMLVSLYTVRAVLNTLGVEDYGIYDVVAGVVAIFGFLSGQLAYATQRFLSFELGRGDFEQVKHVFSLSFFIYVLLAVLIVIFAETVGLWFVNNKLIIPAARMNAVHWIYQFSIVSFVFTLLATPFTAAVLSHEDMNIYALLSIVKVFLQLGMVILLQYISWDKLIFYGMLLCLLSIINTIIYSAVCLIKYQECTFAFFWNKDLFKEITVYNGWMLFASFAGIFKNQIINILLNQFFNPAIVAARSIASSVNTAVSSFFTNFNMSLRPPIVKSYAANQTEKMLSLIFIGTKGTFFLMYVFSLPLLLEMPIVLSLWLKNVPEYAALFTRLTLIDVLISSISYSVDTAALATKKIGLFEATLGGSLLFNLPVAWVALSLHAPAYSVMIIAIIITSIMFVLRFVIIRQIIDFPVTTFFKTVLIPISIVALASAVLPVLIFHIMNQGFPRLLLITGASIVSVCGCMYFIGLSKMERKQLNKIITNRFFRINK